MNYSPSRLESHVPHTHLRRRDLLLAVTGFVLLALVLALAYRAYLSPGMMIDLANLRLCA